MDAKRVLDLAIGIPAAVIMTPLIAVLALVVLATSGRPVFLVQARVGARERTIPVFNLRTMRQGVPVVAKSEMQRSAQLYTPLGATLRRWSLDELPHLYNVVRGEMSLVGPRPALPTQVDLLALRRRRGVTDLTWHDRLLVIH